MVWIPRKLFGCGMAVDMLEWDMNPKLERASANFACPQLFFALHAQVHNVPELGLCGNRPTGGSVPDPCALLVLGARQAYISSGLSEISGHWLPAFTEPAFPDSGELVNAL